MKSLRIEHGAIVITGLIPSTAFRFDIGSELAGQLRARSMGNLHLTWNSLLHANSTDDIGYMVLQTPVATAGNISPAEDDNSCWVTLTIERTHHTLPPGWIGAVCCLACNRPIALQRLKAVPNTKFCTVCQQTKENKHA